MGDRFDTLAKDAATLPRREVFRRIGGGLMAILLASVGLAAGDNCGKLCADCCKNLDFPPRSAEHGKCISDCHRGEGDCGPIVCPDGSPR
jgi:hypothetical protein